MLAEPAYAYRPFNSTDAAVAARGEMEIECGPLGYSVVGGIWQVRKGLSLDAGVRIARADGATLRELRAGFTWAFALKSGADARRTGPPSLPRWSPQA
jgi:hypothetical protein